MNTRQHTEPKQDVSSARMVLVMGGIGLLASVLLVTTYTMTTPYIEQNRAEYLERAIFDVLPGATQKVTYVRQDERLVIQNQPAPDAETYYAGYNEQGELVGIAVEAAGQGYQDMVRILYGYVPDCACVAGMKVLESKETPGLGDRIEKDPDFLANFDALDLRLRPDGLQLEHPVELVKKGAKTEPWQVEAIAGATISSEAIARMIDRKASEALPLIHRNLTAFEARE